MVGCILSWVEFEIESFDVQLFEVQSVNRFYLFVLYYLQGSTQQNAQIVRKNKKAFYENKNHCQKRVGLRGILKVLSHEIEENYKWDKSTEPK
jgi:hypothetical protein